MNKDNLIEKIATFCVLGIMLIFMGLIMWQMNSIEKRELAVEAKLKDIEFQLGNFSTNTSFSSHNSGTQTASPAYSASGRNSKFKYCTSSEF